MWCRSKLISRRDGEDVCDGGWPSVKPALDSAVLRGKNQVRPGAEDEVSKDRAVACIELQRVGSGREDQTVEVAGQRIVKTEGCVGFHCRTKAKLQLTPTADGVDTGAASEPCDDVNAREYVLIGATTKGSQATTAIGFASNLKPFEERTLPISSDSPGVDAGRAVVILATRICADAQHERMGSSRRVAVRAPRDTAFVTGTAGRFYGADELGTGVGQRFGIDEACLEG